METAFDIDNCVAVVNADQSDFDAGQDGDTGLARSQS